MENTNFSTTSDESSEYCVPEKITVQAEIETIGTPTTDKNASYKEFIASRRPPMCSTTIASRSSTPVLITQQESMRQMLYSKRLQKTIPGHYKSHVALEPIDEDAPSKLKPLKRKLFDVSAQSSAHDATIASSHGQKIATVIKHKKVVGVAAKEQETPKPFKPGTFLQDWLKEVAAGRPGFKFEKRDRDKMTENEKEIDNVYQLEKMAGKCRRLLRKLQSE